MISIDRAILPFVLTLPTSPDRNIIYKNGSWIIDIIISTNILINLSIFDIM